jgi:2-(1,2-epoxy-1,2-dihydrophenyl)acetyl-CoA isomerase
MLNDTTDSVALSLSGEVATIRLCRTARLNAFDAGLHYALSDALDLIERDRSLRALIITGEGRAFCAGQDLEERAQCFRAGQVPDLFHSVDQLYNRLIRRIAALEIPAIAAVNGMAFGAGAALAMGCDIAIAAQTARFQFGFVNVGLGLDCGASWLLPRLVGQQRAMEIALSGRAIDAEEAARIGMVDVLERLIRTLSRSLGQKSNPLNRECKALTNAHAHCY